MPLTHSFAHCRIARDGTEQALCNIIWSFAIAGRIKENEKAVRMLWREANKKHKDIFLEKEWKQLKIAGLFARCEGLELVASEEVRRTSIGAVAFLPHKRTIEPRLFLPLQLGSLS